MEEDNKSYDSLLEKVISASVNLSKCDSDVDKIDLDEDESPTCKLFRIRKMGRSLERRTDERMKKLRDIVEFRREYAGMLLSLSNEQRGILSTAICNYTAMAVYSVEIDLNKEDI